MQKYNNIVLCKLPKAGLGNQLFTLLKGYVFAELNGFQILVSGFNYFKIGPYLRAEKSKRDYHKYFIFQKNSLLSLIKIISFRLRKFANITHEASLDKVNITMKNHCYIYSEIPHWSDSFAALKNHRPLVIAILNKIINDEILNEVNAKPAPIIGMHIRMGDFKKLKDGEDFKKTGGVRTPEKYFINIIEDIRKINGQTLSVSVFTDGYKDELANLFKMDNIELIEGNRDIVDLLLLSKSKIIITSAGSSFSYWAGFLSESPIILHPDHIHNAIRPSTNTDHYEGPLDISSLHLLKRIKSISEN